MDTTNATQIQTGWDVYGSDGEKIGSVAGVSNDHFIIEKGFIFTTDLYVPLSAVASVNDDEVELIYTKEQVENQDWSSAPMGGDAYASGTTVDTYDSTATGDTYDSTGTADTYQSTGTADTYDGDRDDSTLERREERLTVDRQAEQAGTVHVGKHVEEEVQSVDVPVTREEVTLERRSVDRPATGEAFTEDSIDVPVYEERVDVNKETRVVEELDVDKTAYTDTERVQETVRREEFDIDDSTTGTRREGDTYDR
jgi:uncharacterized protein (TIGR02271 family)